MLYCIRGKGQEVCGEVCELLDVWWVWGVPFCVLYFLMEGVYMLGRQMNGSVIQHLRPRGRCSQQACFCFLEFPHAIPTPDPAFLLLLFCPGRKLECQ